MKFDPKFVRNLLFLYEEADFAGVNEKELLDTIAIMNKGKLVTNKIHYAGKTPMWIAEGSITDTGKDYLDKIKNPLVWKKTQKILLSATKVTLQSILSTAISVAING
ncbi:hypothetical protein BBP13_09375 [Limosilactobacillus reuteri]|uniref:DUF2513 domain-containing protein n=1 Tax=Limosilactobacillus reuteri TaxID=1598 RepID=UPI00081C15DD|nr:DUF2513 domain-containing protein [Limosilactobacillus reuteri]OCW67424.1 hypothetical protein BBP13_09375 [Limosilactobacillus reuteri]